MAGKKGRSGGNRKPTLSPKVQLETRAKIETTTIVNKLMKLVKGEIQMDSTQLKAAEVLLRKSLPDLQSVEITGDPDKPVNLNATVEFVGKSTDT